MLNVYLRMHLFYLLILIISLQCSLIYNSLITISLCTRNSTSWGFLAVDCVDSLQSMLDVVISQ
jgi:hypothetical protein